MKSSLKHFFQGTGLVLGFAAAAVSLNATPVAGPGVRLCTVGYVPDVAKVATVVGADKGGSFEIVDTKSGKVVYTGNLGANIDCYQTREQTREADFTGFSTPGSYVVRVAGLPDSTPFTIASGSLNRSLDCLMIGFYGQRCGEAVSFEWNGQTFHHGACHLDDGWLDYNDPSKAGQKKEAVGGWHDAGDHGKYSLNAAFTNAALLQAWERNEALKQLQLPWIPEHGGALPDYLAELKYDLDWMFAMQMENGEVAHKLTTLQFGPLALMPEDDHAKRFFTPNSRISTLDFAAMGCMAARVYRPYDAAYADKWLAAAKRAWEAARTMPDANPDTSAFGTGNYFVSSSESDYKWALIEVRMAFGDAFLTDMERFLFNGYTNSDNHMFTTAWDWGNGYNLGLLDWFFSGEAKKNPLAYANLRQDLLDTADGIVRKADAHAYGRGFIVSHWGINGVIARSSLVLHAAYLASGERKYLDTLYDQIAYLYGRNPFGRSFVTGDGYMPPMNPHHRTSVGDDVVDPWPGHLVSGANPTETDWLDETPSYATNENAINWDAALTYALAVFYQP